MSKFDFSTIKDFDNHISNSIFGYNILHDLIVNLSSFFIKQNTVPIDIGCSSGRLIQKINEIYNVKSIGFDITDNNFLNDLDLRVVDITNKNFSIPQTDLIYSVFTLQFIDVSKRQDLLNKIFNSLNDGGAFFFCEKEYCIDGKVQECFIFSNYLYKQKNFSEIEILKKEKDLRKIMTPLNSEQNISMLKKAGFARVEMFFQSLNFKGYLCIK